jgi:general secretion pathway protein M
MKQYLDSLQPRERHTLLGGGIALLLILLYALILEPFQTEYARLQQSVAAQAAELAWMQQASADVKRLRGNTPAARRSSGQSLMSLVDANARSTGLTGAIKEIKPEGQGVRVRLEQVAFDDMLRWLEQLHSRQGVSVTGLVMERLPQPGRVNASVVLGGEN